MHTVSLDDFPSYHKERVGAVGRENVFAAPAVVKRTAAPSRMSDEDVPLAVRYHKAVAGASEEATDVEMRQPRVRKRTRVGASMPSLVEVSLRDALGENDQQPFSTAPKEVDLTQHAEALVDAHDRSTFAVRSSMAWRRETRCRLFSDAQLHRFSASINTSGLPRPPSAFRHHAMPSGVDGILLQHQKEGVRFLMEHLVLHGTGCMLADYMGLGKTLQCVALCSMVLGTRSLQERCHAAIAAWAARRRRPNTASGEDDDDAVVRCCSVPTLRAKPFRIVVVAPSGVVPHWVEEMRRYSSALVQTPLATWSRPVSDPCDAATQSLGGVHANAFVAFDADTWLREDDVEASIASIPFKLPKKASWLFEITANTRHKSVLLGVYRRLGGVLCVPYAQVLVDSCRRDVVGDMIILDEGHRIRNTDTVISKWMWGFPSPLRVVASGYPLQNKLHELYRLLLFVSDRRIASAEEGLGDDRFFQQHFAEPLHDAVLPTTRGAIQRETLYHTTRGWLLRRAALFYAVSSKYILRRGLRVLQSLIGQSRNVFHVKLRPTMAQVHAYNCVVCSLQCAASSLDMLVIGSEMSSLPLGRIRSSAEGVVNTISVVRRVVASNTMLFADMAVTPKMRFLWTAARELRTKGRRLIAFSQFHSVLDEVPRAFDALDAEARQANAAALCDVTPLRIGRCDGLVPVDERVRICHCFNTTPPQSTDGIDVLLFSLKAGCEGLNLIGASMIVSLDVSYNPAVEHEAFARAYRLGQGMSVDVVVLSVAGSAEAMRFATQCGKARLADVCVDGALGAASNTCDDDTAASKHSTEGEDPHGYSDDQDQLRDGPVDTGWATSTAPDDADAPSFSDTKSRRYNRRLPPAPLLRLEDAVENNVETSDPQEEWEDIPLESLLLPCLQQSKMLVYGVEAMPSVDCAILTDDALSGLAWSNEGWLHDDGTGGSVRHPCAATVAGTEVDDAVAAFKRLVELAKQDLAYETIHGRAIRDTGGGAAVAGLRTTESTLDTTGTVSCSRAATGCDEYSFDDCTGTVPTVPVPVPLSYFASDGSDTVVDFSEAVEMPTSMLQSTHGWALSPPSSTAQHHDSDEFAFD